MAGEIIIGVVILVAGLAFAGFAIWGATKIKRKKDVGPIVLTALLGLAAIVAIVSGSMMIYGGSKGDKKVSLRTSPTHCTPQVVPPVVVHDAVANDVA